MMRHFATCAALLAIVVATSPTGAQTLVPMSPGGIVTAISDCIDATGPQGIDETRLAALGWAKGSMSRAGKPVDTGLGFYGKSGSAALVMTHETDKVPATMCMVTAKLKQAQQYQAVVNGIDALDGVGAVKKDKLTIVFMSDRHILQSELLGSTSEPTVRIAISAVPEKN